MDDEEVSRPKSTPIISSTPYVTPSNPPISMERDVVEDEAVQIEHTHAKTVSVDCVNMLDETIPSSPTKTPQQQPPLLPIIEDTPEDAINIASTVASFLLRNVQTCSENTIEEDCIFLTPPDTPTTENQPLPERTLPPFPQNENQTDDNPDYTRSLIVTIPNQEAV